MDASELLEQIELLIHQAEQGEIDPWDVQVIEVIDRYLELMAPEATVRRYDTDLSQSGQAFLSASMLVLFKANTLMQYQVAQDEEEVVLDDLLPSGEDGLMYRTARLPLEKQLRRRATAMPPPKRRVTLQELIDQLQVMANQLKLVQNKVVKPKTPRRQGSVTSLRAALELAHQENLTEVAGELEQMLVLAAPELFREQDWLPLEQLVELWKNKQQAQAKDDHHHSPQSHLVGVFWALLLLSAQSKVELFQEEFYQEVKIRLLREPANGSKPLEKSVS